MENDFFLLFQGEFLGATEYLKKMVLSFRTECSKRKFVFHFFKASKVPGLNLRGCFSVNGTDLYKGLYFPYHSPFSHRP